eukprot:GAHX01000865.1.p1 GENE.GAHX01000865.1~~GAHX01000865.1.p1  ORF type:complete len:616 (-),score=99.04 GAHX01000865.1:1006-2853(-)
MNQGNTIPSSSTNINHSTESSYANEFKKYDISHRSSVRKHKKLLARKKEKIVTDENCRPNRFEIGSDINRDKILDIPDNTLAHTTIEHIMAQNKSLLVVNPSSSGKTTLFSRLKGVAQPPHDIRYWNYPNIRTNCPPMDKYENVLFIDLDFSKTYKESKILKGCRESNFIKQLTFRLINEIETKINLTDKQTKQIIAFKEDNDKTIDNNEYIIQTHINLLAYLFEIVQLQYRQTFTRDVIVYDHINNKSESKTTAIKQIFIIIDEINIFKLKDITSIHVKNGDFEKYLYKANLYILIIERVLIRDMNGANEGRMKFIFSSILPISQIRDDSIRYLKFQTFTEFLIEKKLMHSFGEISFFNFLQVISQHINGQPNKLARLAEQATYKPLAFKPYVDEYYIDGSYQMNMLTKAWEKFYPKKQEYKTTRLKDGTKTKNLYLKDNAPITERESQHNLYCFFIEIFGQLIKCAKYGDTALDIIIDMELKEYVNNKTTMNEKQKKKDHIVKSCLKTINPGYFVNFVLHNTDKNSITFRPPKNASSEKDMVPFWELRSRSGLFDNITEETISEEHTIDTDEKEYNMLYGPECDVSDDIRSKVLYDTFHLGHMHCEIIKNEQG